MFVAPLLPGDVPTADAADTDTGVAMAERLRDADQLGEEPAPVDPRLGGAGPAPTPAAAPGKDTGTGMATARSGPMGLAGSPTRLATTAA